MSLDVSSAAWQTDFKTMRVLCNVTWIFTGIETGYATRTAAGQGMLAQFGVQFKPVQSRTQATAVS